MTQRQAWSLTGVAPEAREAARAAAQVEGISVGEWLRRRILAEDAGADAPSEAGDDEPMPRPRLVSNADEDLRRADAASEADSDFANRRIDEAVQAMAHLLETSERSQSDAKRAMNGLAVEIKTAAQDQATAFQDLNQRIERVERSSEVGGLRNTVRGLSQGLSQLTEQATHHLIEVRGQINTLAETLKALTGKVSSTREDSTRIGLFVQEQLSTFAERVRATEGRAAQIPQVEETVDALSKRVAVLGQIEKSITQLGERDIKAMRQIDDVAGHLETLAGQVDSARAETDQIAGRLNAAEARMDLYSRLEVAVEALSSRIAGLGLIERSISELGERDTEAMRTLNALAGNVETLAGQIALARENSSQIVERMRSAEGNIARLSKVEDTAETLRKRITALSQIEKSIAELGERDTAAKRQIDMLAGNFESLSGEVSSARGEFSQLAERMRSAEARTAHHSEIEETVETLRKRTAGLSQIAESVMDLGKRDAEATRQIDALAGNLDSLSDKLSSASKESDRLAERMLSAEGRIARQSQVEATLDVLSKRVAGLDEVGKSLAELNERDMEAVRTMNALAGNLEKLEGKFFAADVSAGQIAERLQSAEARIASYSGVEDSVKTINQRVTALDEMKKSVAELGQFNNNAARQINAVVGDLKSLAAQVSSSRKDSEQIGERVQAAEAGIAKLAGAEEGISTLKKRLSGLNEIEKSVTELTERDDKAVRQIDSLVADLEALTGKVSSAEAESIYMAERLQSAEGRMARFSEAEKTLEALSQRVAGLDDIEKSVSDLDKYNGESAREIAALTDELSSAQEQSVHFGERLQSAEAGMARHSKVEEAVENLSKRVAGLEQIEKSIAGLGERDAEAMRQIGALAGNLESLAGQLPVQSAEAQIARQSQIEDALETLNKRIAGPDGIESSVAELGKHNGETAQHIDAMADNLAALAGTVSSAREEFEQIVERLNAAEARWSTSPEGEEQSAQHDERLESLAVRIDENERHRSENDADVREKISRLEKLLIDNEKSSRQILAELRTGLKAMAGRLSAVEERDPALAGAAPPAMPAPSAPMSEADYETEDLPESDLALSMPSEPPDAADEETEDLAESDLILSMPSEPFDAAEDEAEDLPESDLALSMPAAPLDGAEDENEVDPQAESDPWAPEESSDETISSEPPPLLTEAELPPVTDVEHLPAEEHSATETRLPAKDQAYLAQARRAALATMEGVEMSSPERSALARAFGKGGQEKRVSSGPIAVLALLLLLIPIGYFVGRSLTSQTTDVASAPGGIDEAGAPLPGAPASAPANVAAQDSGPANGPARSAPNVSYSSLDDALARANTGDARAMLALGIAYADGNGITQNDAEAVTWLRRAAQMGEALAQYRLGVRLERGVGLAKNPTEAAHWYAEAAQHGNSRAMYNLGVAYANGAGIDRNLSEAIRWFQSAAELGLSDAQFNLAVMYERGMGVSASLPEAYKWYAIAQAAGDTESKARVEALATQIPAAQKDAAEQAVVSFKPKPMNREANEAPQLAAKAIP